MAFESGVCLAVRPFHEVVLEQEHVINRAILLFKPRVQGFISGQVHWQRLQEDLPVLVTGLHIRSLGHGQVIEEPSAVGGARCDCVTRFATEELALREPSLNDLPVTNLSIVELIHSDRQHPRDIQLDACATSQGIAHKVHCFDAAIGCEDGLDLFCLPTVREALHQDARPNGAVIIISSIRVFRFLRFLFLLRSFLGISFRHVRRGILPLCIHLHPTLSRLFLLNLWLLRLGGCLGKGHGQELHELDVNPVKRLFLVLIQPHGKMKLATVLPVADKCKRSTMCLCLQTSVLLGEDVAHVTM
mmetsp:Transcript_55835/g.148896  ORF Transcript_55835/g.148896 Transcript_55835/m.148896 type:complete len:302 (-) Transcript_55835:1550-2455(-)